MAYVNWSDELSVNVAEIDEQHKQLVSMINDLHDAMTQGQGTEVLGRIVDGLIDYTRVHFDAEEKAFDASAYPDAEAHKRQHDQFVDKVVDFKHGFDEGRILLSLDVMSFLSDWLVDHIKVSDREYAPYVN